MEKQVIDSFRGENRFLSNFWLVNIFYEGRFYPSVEHAYQASKSDREEVREKISNLEKPSDAKQLGKELELLKQIRLDWNDVFRLEVMQSLVQQKFCIDNSELVEKLLSTEWTELIEGNTWDDIFWGVCNGKGDNHLGKILMNVRSSLFKSKVVAQSLLNQIKGDKAKVAFLMGITEQKLNKMIQTFKLNA